MFYGTRPVSRALHLFLEPLPARGSALVSSHVAPRASGLRARGLRALLRICIGSANREQYMNIKESNISSAIPGYGKRGWEGTRQCWPISLEGPRSPPQPMSQQQNGGRYHDGGRRGDAPQLAKHAIRDAFDGTPDKPNSARSRRDDSPASSRRGSSTLWEPSDVNGERQCAQPASLHTARECLISYLSRMQHPPCKALGTNGRTRSCVQNP
jgi:hypothetical protein